MDWFRPFAIIGLMVCIAASDNEIAQALLLCTAALLAFPAKHSVTIYNQSAKEPTND